MAAALVCVDLGCGRVLRVPQRFGSFREVTKGVDMDL